MYIVCDSNIWIKELGLNSAKGAAARFFVKKQGATVVLPEVVKLETERNLRSELKRYTAHLERTHRGLLTIFGTLKELVLPDEKEIDAKVASVFGECQVELLERPLTLESARSSFLKTIDKTAPSDMNQQFKDGVIWHECLSLLDAADVHLVTGDKAFYEGKEYRNGLAKSLAQEAENAKHAIHIYHELSALLETIKTEVSLNKHALASQFWESSQSSIERLLDGNSFAVRGEPTIDFQLYATENPSRLFAEFNVYYNCEDLTSEGRSDAMLTLKGDCNVVEEEQFESFRNHEAELTFRTKDGEDQRRRNITMFVDSIVMSHRTVEHTTKYKLDG